jgi:hypothetical protein
MGRPVTSKYAISITIPGYPPILAAWHCGQSGRPTEANLARRIEVFEASTRQGGCNDHLGEQYVTRAHVKVNTPTGEIVATYTAPMFRVIADSAAQS